MRCRTGRTLTLTAILTAVLLPSARAAPDDPAPKPLRFRRVLVPRDALAELTRGYLPMTRTEFAARWAEIVAASTPADQRVAWVTSAEYSARFDAGQLVDGLARLQIVHHAAEPAYVSLAPAALAMGPATWQGTPLPRAADTGTDPSGNSVVRVTESGVLEYPWTLRGEAGDAGAFRFAVAVTAAPRSRLALDLPDTYELLTDHGLVVQAEDLPQADDDDTPGVLRRWTIELGGVSSLELTVAPRASSSQRRPLISVEQNLRYRLEPDSVQVECEVDLDVHSQPPTELQLETDDSLLVTAVRLGNQELDWQSLPSETPAGRIVRVQFADQLSGSHSTLFVSAVAPLQTLSPWRLPTLRPRQVLWRQGTMSLEVPDTLELHHLYADQAEQSAVRTDGGDAPHTTLQFELFGPESALEVVLARRTPDVVAEMGTTIDMDSGAVTAVVVADVRCRRGERFDLQALVPNAWTVDGVESEPAAAVHDYQFVAYEAQAKRLRIQLAEPLRPEQPLRLTIRAHRSPSVFLGPEELRPLQWVGVQYASRLMALVPDTNFRLDLSGDAALERLDPAGLSPTDANRLQPRVGGIVFDDDERAGQVAVTMTREEPEFAANVTVDVDVTADALVESYRVTCTPSTAPLERVRVHFSEPRAADLAWRWVGDEPGMLSARRLREAGEQEAEPALEGEEVWEIVLRTPQRSPFELRAQRTSPATLPCNVALATLPDAASHAGELTLRAKNGDRLAVQVEGVTPIPCDPVPLDAATTVRACYRYDASKTARVTLRRLTDQGGPAALWAWRCSVLAQREPSGPTHHTASLLLENTGVTDLRVTLPTQSVFQGLDINGEPAPRAVRAEADGRYVVTLPAGPRFLRVDLRYRCPGSPLGLWSEVAVRPPQLDIPVLDYRTQLWLPPGYRPARAALDPSPSWPARLLGPLAARRDAAAPSWVADALRAWLGYTSPAGPDPAALGAAFLEQFGSAILADHTESAREPRTWRRVLSQCPAAVAPVATSVIWVDAERLAQAGFSLEAPLPPAGSSTASAAAESVLRQGGLLLVAYRGKLYMTSSSLTGQFPSAGQWLADRVLFVPDRGSPLAAAIDALESRDGPAPLPLATWTAVPALADPPWRFPGGPARVQALDSGGQWLDISPCAATGSCSLRVERPAVLWAIGWCALIGTAALVMLFGRRRRALGLGITGAAVVAVAAPASLVPLTSALVPGMLAGLLLRAAHQRWMRPPPDVDEPTSDPAHPVASIVAMFLAAVGLTLLSVRLATADGLEDIPSSDADRPVYPLIVPVDENLNPVGQYDYLPVEFYDALHPRSSAEASPQRAWLATQADYRLAFHTRPQRAAMEVTSFSATYRLLVLAAADRLWFPWDGQSQSTSLLEAQWNSQPIEPEWNATRTAFALPASQPGPGVLELTLRAEVRDEPGKRLFACPIPRIARSQLELNLPVGAPALQVTSALGASRVDGATGTQYVDLGPADALTLQWPSGAPDEALARPISVAELLWLKVCPKNHPDSVRLSAQLQLQPAGQRITELALRVDPQLRWLPPTEPAPFSVTTSPPEAPDAGLLTLRWPTPVESETAVLLEFELLNASGLGNIPLPQLETVGTRASRRWLAVSVAPNLDTRPASSELYEPLSSAEFLAAWGESESAPQLCYRLTAEDPGWSLATRSRQPLTSVRERLDISVSLDRLDLVLEAELDTANGTVFQHRVAVPRDLQVTSAVVLSGQTDVAAPVVYDGSGTISVFLRRGVSGVHYLILRGHVPQAVDSDARPIPQVTLLDATVRGQAVYLYRQSEVLLDVQAAEGMARAPDAAEGRYRESFGRLVAAFAAPSGPLAGWTDTRLTVQANRPQVDARLVVVLQRDADRWLAIADLDAQVAGETRGVVDLFRFELPPEWVGPFVLEPPAPHEIRALPDQRRQLLVRPAEPIHDRLRMRIRGSVALGPTERGRTPDIRPLDVTNLERFFVLPTRWDQQRIEWASPGLVEVPLADVVPPDLADPAGQIAFRAWSQPRAVITQIGHEAGERQIPLADILVRGTDDGGWYGVASFAIQPAGAESCTLELPSQVELVHAEIDGVPAMLVPLQERHWQVRLVSEQLTQQLTVLFRTVGLDGAARPPRQLAVPWITDVPTRQTLWTVYRTTETPWEETVEQRAQVPATYQESLRLATTAYLVESSADAVLDLPSRDVQAWYTPWAERLATACARLAHAHTWPDSPEGAASAETTDAVLQQQELVAQRLKAAPTVLDFLRQSNRQPQPQDLWAFAAGGQVVPHHYIFTGSAPTLPFAEAAAPTAGWRTALSAAAIMLALAAGLGLAVRCGLASHAWQRWPQAVGVLVGVTWWLVAAPGALGWLIVAASVWSAVRLPWTTRTVLPTGGESAESAAPSSELVQAGSTPPPG